MNGERLRDLRAKAMSARQLARDVEPQTAANLNRYAEELEAEAVKLEDEMESGG